MNKTVKNLIKLLSGTAITGIICFAGTVYNKTEAIVTQVSTISASETSESETQKTKIVIDDQRDIYYFDPQGLEAGRVYRKQDLAYTPTELIIPKTYNGKPVWLLGSTHITHFSTDINIPATQIYYGPFFNCYKLKRVFIPDTITNAYNIFETDQDLPEDSVNKNDLDIYVYSDNIRNFFERSYGETIFITGYSYYDVSYSALIDGEVLEELTVPENITEINEGAFFKCKSLKKVTVPNTVTSIGQWAFCSPDLESITIYNPDCVIAEDSIANRLNGDFKFDGVIYGYENSTAQAYAEKYGYKFESLGDIPQTTEPVTTTPITATTTAETTATAAATTVAAPTTARPVTIKPITTSYLVEGIPPGEQEAHADDISLVPGETTVMKFTIPGKLGRYESCNGYIYLPEGLKCEKVTYGDGKEVNNIHEILNGDETVYSFSMPETSVILTITADKELSAGKYIVKCDAIKSYREPVNGNPALICVGGYRYADKEVEITVNGNDEENTNYISNEIATMYGDTDENGYVNIADLVKMNLYIINHEKYPMSTVQLANADCLKDNAINSGDSVLLMNYLCCIITSDMLGKTALYL